MKHRILFLTYTSKNWMGGIYYIKNQIVQLLKYAPSRKNIKIYLYVTKETMEEYTDLLNNPYIIVLYKEDIAKKALVQFNKMMEWELEADILYMVCRYRIEYIFPYFPEGKWNKRIFLKKSIAWIPDFQHIHFPEYFSREELLIREEQFKDIAQNHNKLVLSSKDAYRDYIKKYPNSKRNVYIIPFCSALNRSVVKENKVGKVKQKYGITNNYFIICNQFWVHKNHMFVFEVLKRALEFDNRICIVCTGDLSDYRNRKYINDIQNYVKDHELTNNVYLLGLIDKAEQIQLLKGAIALIQPSLFEGWATGVEDAKTLKKRIILSNIDVHHEQANDMCVFFDPNSPDDLLRLIVKVWEQEKDKIQKSGYSLKYASKYGKRFYKMLMSGER